MSVNLNNFSVVTFFDSTEKHRCGYCKSENSSLSNGMWAEHLTVEDYQDLIDRGWRRSGKYCYKPIMNQTCCPQYTIRCEALNISLSKSQKKVIKKLNKFLEDGVLNKKDIPNDSFESQHYEIQQEISKNLEPNINLSEVKLNSNKTELLQESSTDHGTGEPCHTKSVDRKKNAQKDESGHTVEQKGNISMTKIQKKGMGADCSKLPCKKAKLLRIERKKEKLNKMGLNLEDVQKEKSEPKSLEEFIENFSENSKLKVKITIVRMNPSNDTFQASAKLFAKYQMHVHNEPIDECDEVQFSRFLVHTPLKPKESSNGKGPGFGSFHQQYWINDKLIAVGVIDILPRCVSSVYFFYDPDYTNLSLGTYSSLREVYFTRSLQKDIPELCYYYMGFYIHSCPKMRYKGKLVPSHLLCPETYCWISIEKAISLLEINKYSRLNSDASAVDVNVPTDRDSSKTKVVYDHQFMTLATYKKMSLTANHLFNQIGLLVGRLCLQRMVFWIQ